MTMRLVAIPDVFLPDGTVQRGELHALLDQFMRNRPSVLRVNIGLARQLRAGIITINEVRQQMGLLMTVSLAAVPDVFLPDGTVRRGRLSDLHDLWPENYRFVPPPRIHFYPYNLNAMNLSKPGGSSSPVRNTG